MSDEKELLINSILMEINLDAEMSVKLKNIMHMKMYDYSVEKITNTDITLYEENADQEAIKMFFVAKRVQGCTDRTLQCYKTTLKMFFEFIEKSISKITTNDIRYFLAVKKERDHVSDTHVDNIRRVLSTFFVWLMEEEYITRNPVAKVKKIRTEKYVKKAFKDIEIERLRLAAVNDIRLTALLEILLSTGCRIGEVRNMNWKDIDGDEVVVYGKGKKERIVYLNAKARVALEAYLKTREDDHPALFIAKDKPVRRLEISGMEICIRALGKKAGIKDTHPHRFRRTAATQALNRGMPIDQVQQMLGHSSIETTTIYATSAQEAVKANHKKYVV